MWRRRSRGSTSESRTTSVRARRGVASTVGAAEELLCADESTRRELIAAVESECIASTEANALLEKGARSTFHARV